MDKLKIFLDKHSLSSHHLKSKQTPQLPINPVRDFPSEYDFYRYRKQRGVNLGSWFVLERWIADSPFRFAEQPGQSDHDVAKGSYGQNVLDRHWNDWIVEEDWQWISDRGINTVRIPIAFYHLCGVDPSVLNGTDFAHLGSVFQGAWARITSAIATAHRYGIGVLIDLHAAPGKQNADAHSGTSSPEVAFFSSSNMSHTKHILTSLLINLTTYTRTHDPPLPNVVGIELINEPNPPGGDHSALKKWYRSTFEAMRRIDPDMPLYIGDSWRTSEYTEFITSLGSHASSESSSFVALDHHLYRCFTSQDASTSAAGHAQALRESSPFSAAVPALASAGAGLVVGEWSGALNPDSFRGTADEHAEKRNFVDAQLALYERECAGWFYWTLKKQQGGDSGWAMRDAVAYGVFPSWVGTKANKDPRGDDGRQWRRDQARDQALSAHTGWWSKHPGHYEHWRFSEGFICGWNDAYMLFSSPPTRGGSIPEIGFKGAWAKRRAAAHARERGQGNLWEYEHGITQGIDAAKADFVQNYA
ncbi:glycoside hydrolase family 5 protein [Heterobasidion irregulare TC 32-1]|uniref:Glycoside hydrolase family 5 protein n=1 Tax=Heterobasidion irregulare (strain TC 32-1) TaxID=747525 RepID=W4KD57_HETIT|nr:glycoside hydrolase family 5 protein [Heterobasidion irregulare TC 32-1]ETW83016.1 glycoside hydrolase family 5 protein [Heterobasidion irregulare TC 32-1]